MTRASGHAAITLAKGIHAHASEGSCLFEAYNVLARGEHTDSCPPGVSPVLHVYGMRLNDALPDDRRQELKRYLPNDSSPLAGTAGDGKDETRSMIALDWLVRTYTPVWLGLAGLSGEAATLRALHRIDDLAAAQEAGPVVRDASSKAAAAGAAARDAAGDAAGAAARDAAWAAARAAAWAAAGDAAAAGAAAWAEAGDEAGDEAWAAARDAAGAAARAKLAPTVAELQDSAIGLYDVLIAGEWPAEATP